MLTEAIHSSIDLVASVVAFFSVRKADEPADEDHRYGHEKIENLAAAIEGILILVGSAVIAFESIRRLINGGEVQRIGFGIVVVAISIVVNVAVSSVLARNARLTSSPALEADAAHLRTDALTSAGVLVALVLVKVTGANWLDPVVALVVAGSIVVTGVRLLTRSSQVLVDQSLPSEEIDEIRAAIEAFAPAGVVGYHELRTRRAVVATSICTSSFAPAPRLKARTAPRTSSRTGSRRGSIQVDGDGPQRGRVRRGGSGSRQRRRQPELRSRRAARRRHQPRLRGRGSGQVDRRRDRHGQRHPGVAVVPLQRQDQNRDQARGDGRQPADSGQVHGRILAVGADAPALTTLLIRAEIYANCGKRAGRDPSSRALSVDNGRPGGLWAGAQLSAGRVSVETPTTSKEEQVTKSEFVDQVADRAGLSKKDAADAVDAFSGDHRGRAQAGQRCHLLRLRQVQRVGPERPRRTQSGDRREIEIAASEVPKFTAGAALKKAVN